VRIVLSTIGKFHTFDLARQMHRRGALTAVFSGYPRFKLKKEEIPREKTKTFPWLHAPYMRFAPRYEPAKRFWEWQDKVLFDEYVARNLPACDVFCGLSGSALRTGRAAKRYGARYICDRGSSHIRFQNRILCEEYDLQGIPFSGIDPRIIGREETEYQFADAITVPSTFALNSFVEFGIPREKLRLAPYGVDLSLFHPTAAPSAREFRVLFVGAISIRKGICYLLDAFERVQHERKYLKLVGSVSPELRDRVEKLRGRADVSVVGHVPQPQLKGIMSESHIMVLPSIEEGLALVQAQAMACGCPVIASQNTGAQDLFSDGVEGFIVPIRNADAITQCLQKLADNPHLRSQMSAAASERVKSIGGWEQYGQTMYQIFTRVFES
jgi:starch synthase